MNNSRVRMRNRGACFMGGMELMGLMGLLREGFVVVAVDDFMAVAVPVVHAIAEAVAKGFAVLAHSTAGPAAVAEGLEAVLPHLP